MFALGLIESSPMDELDGLWLKELIQEILKAQHADGRFYEPAANKEKPKALGFTSQSIVLAALSKSYVSTRDQRTYDAIRVLRQLLWKNIIKKILKLASRG